MALPPPDNRNMELLPDQRRASKKMYRDRKMNIFKKADELSILCGIDVAVILFQPTDKSTTQPAAEIWPKNPTEVERIIRKYKAKLASTHASSPSTSPPAMKSTTSTPSPSPSPSPSLSPSPSPSPSRSVLEKRKYIDLDLSLSSYSDSRTKMLKDDKGKRKLLTQDDDENINSQEAGKEKKFKSPTTWDHAGRDELYHSGAFMIGCDDHHAKLASLEAKHKAITERIASLEATRTFNFFY